jgi:hypothetical protein
MMNGTGEELVRLPSKIWAALDYAVTVTSYWTSDGRVFANLLDPDFAVVEAAFQAILTSVEGPGPIRFSGYFVEEAEVDRLLEAFEKSPGAARLIGDKLAMAYFFENRMPQELRRLTYLLISGKKAFTKAKAVKPSLSHRDRLLAGLANELEKRFKIPVGSNDTVLGKNSGRPYTSSALVAAALNACGVPITIDLATKRAYKNISLVRDAPLPDIFLHPLMAAWSEYASDNPLPSMDVRKKNALLDRAVIWLSKNI